MSETRRVLSLVVIWGTATAFGLAFALATKVGPVLLTFSRSHGIHVGDLVAFAAAYSAAAVLTRHLLRLPDARSGAVLRHTRHS